MTAEDQDAEVGRLIRERRDLRAHHEALVSKTNQIATLLSSVGHALQVSTNRSGDQSVLAIKDDGTVVVSNQYRPREMVNGTFPTAQEIMHLVAERKEIEGRLSQLDKHLTAFGA